MEQKLLPLPTTYSYIRTLVEHKSEAIVINELRDGGLIKFRAAKTTITQNDQM